MDIQRQNPVNSPGVNSVWGKTAQMSMKMELDSEYNRAYIHEANEQQALIKTHGAAGSLGEKLR